MHSNYNKSNLSKNKHPTIEHYEIITLVITTKHCQCFCNYKHKDQKMLMSVQETTFLHLLPYTLATVITGLKKT